MALIRGPSPSRNRACAKADSIFRIQVQMEARLLWEQEPVFHRWIAPRRAVRLRGVRLGWKQHGSRGLVAQTRLITELR